MICCIHPSERRFLLRLLLLLLLVVVCETSLLPSMAFVCNGQVFKKNYYTVGWGIEYQSSHSLSLRIHCCLLYQFLTVCPIKMFGQKEPITIKVTLIHIIKKSLPFLGQSWKLFRAISIYYSYYSLLYLPHTHTSSLDALKNGSIAAPSIDKDSRSVHGMG